MARIGVLGGSFNPVHRGHLHMARLAMEAARLDSVWLVPARRPPHKPEGSLAPDDTRLHLLELAIRDEPGFAVSDIELVTPSLRYTVDTLDELTRRNPGDDLAFILGWDSLRDLHTWRDPDRLLSRYTVIAVDRPGIHAEDAFQQYGSHCIVVRGNPLAISSTGIRERAGLGLSIHHLVPDAVAEYIERHRPYPGS